MPLSLRLTLRGLLTSFGVFALLSVVSLIATDAAGAAAAGGRTVERYRMRAIEPQSVDDTCPEPLPFNTGYSASMSPDGSFLAVVTCGHVFLEDLGTGEREEIEIDAVATTPVYVTAGAAEVLFGTCLEPRSEAGCTRAQGIWSAESGTVTYVPLVFFDQRAEWTASNNGRFLVQRGFGLVPDYVTTIDRELSVLTIYPPQALECDAQARGPETFRFCEYFQITPDGRYLLFLVNDYQYPAGRGFVDDQWAVHRFDTTTGEIDVVVADIKRIRIHALAISDDGRFVTYGQEILLPLQAGVYLKDMDTGEMTRLDTPTDARFTEELGRTCFPDAVLSRDGRFAMYRVMGAQSKSGLFVYDRVTEQRTEVTRTTDGAVPNACMVARGISDDGSRVLFRESPANLAVQSPATGILTARLESIVLPFSLLAPGTARGE